MPDMHVFRQRFDHNTSHHNMSHYHSMSHHHNTSHYHITSSQDFTLSQYVTSQYVTSQHITTRHITTRRIITASHISTTCHITTRWRHIIAQWRHNTSHQMALIEDDVNYCHFYIWSPSLALVLKENIKAKRGLVMTNDVILRKRHWVLQ